MRRINPLVVALLALAVLSACSRHAPPRSEPALRRSGTAEMEFVPPDVSVTPAEVYEERLPPEAAPKTLEQTLPAYPESALADEVACVARLLYHIEIDGLATLVRLEWDVAPPDAHLEAFESSIREAVRSWRFDPAQRLNRVRRPDGSITFSPQRIPKAVTVLIRFRVEGGRAIVE